MPKPKKSAKTVLPHPLPNGEILTDLTKKQWCLGPSIGTGGFGEIYSAAEYAEGVKKNLNYQYVVKIEPHGNGPLFCEMHFFMRNSKPEMIQSWCTEKKLSTLGIPRFLGSGSHEHKSNKYRFLTMDKYGKDLWKIFLENNRSFPIFTIYRIALQLLDSLEYIHNRGYVHADIKGANILLGLTKQTQNQVYLVDFGLASKVTQKDFKPDPKKAHNGTIEYTSRDAHDGVPTRRGDIEILAYNLIQWSGTVLPWENNLTDPVAVQNEKKKYMSNTKLFLKTCFGNKSVPGALSELLEYISSMKYDTEPDYTRLRTIFTKGIKGIGGSFTGNLQFKQPAKHKSEENDEPDSPQKRQKLTPSRRTPRGKDATKDKADSILKGKAKNVKVSKIESDEEVYDLTVEKTKKGRKKVVKVDNEDKSSVLTETNGYNSEMLRIQKKLADRNTTKSKKSKADSKNNSVKDLLTPDCINDDIIEGTPPEKISPRKKKYTKTTSNNEFSESGASPRSVRNRR